MAKWQHFGHVFIHVAGSLSGQVAANFSRDGRDVSRAGVAEPEEEKPIPAVPIKRSVTPDHIVCLEDGKKLKMLKRHLKTLYDMTPDEYRRRWGLKDDYPMVAPS